MCGQRFEKQFDKLSEGQYMWLTIEARRFVDDLHENRQ